MFYTWIHFLIFEPIKYNCLSKYLPKCLREEFFLTFVLYRFMRYLESHSCLIKTRKSRSSRSQMFFKVGALKVCNVIKKRLQHRCFPVNIAKHLKTAFLLNIFGGCFWESLRHPLVKQETIHYFILKARI